jgi:hypothetical protein
MDAYSTLDSGRRLLSCGALLDPLQQFLSVLFEELNEHPTIR